MVLTQQGFKVDFDEDEASGYSEVSGIARNVFITIVTISPDCFHNIFLIKACFIKMFEWERFILALKQLIWLFYNFFQNLHITWQYYFAMFTLDINMSNQLWILSLEKCVRLMSYANSMLFCKNNDDSKVLVIYSSWSVFLQSSFNRSCSEGYICVFPLVIGALCKCTFRPGLYFGDISQVVVYFWEIFEEDFFVRMNTPKKDIRDE